MTPQERAQAALERGPLRELELQPEDLAGLDTQQRVAMAKKALFLRAFTRRGIVLDGQTAAGVARTTVKYWRDSDEWFEALYQAALEEAVDAMEAEAHRRAFEGVDKPVVFQGLPTMVESPDQPGVKKMFTVKEYSDSLAQLLLKGNRGEKYRDRVDQKHTFDGQAGVLIVPAAVDPKSWAEAAAAQQSKYAGNTGEEKK